MHQMGPDGEMNVRIKVLQNDYFNLFYPSIPAGEFEDL